MSITLNDERKAFLRAVGIWLLIEVVSDAINALVVQSERKTEGLAFLLWIGAGGLTLIQVLSASALIWCLKLRSRILSVLVGAAAGFLMPIVLFLLMALIVSLFNLEPGGVRAYFEALAWVEVFCIVSLLGAGLLGGAWVGLVRSLQIKAR